MNLPIRTYYQRHNFSSTCTIMPPCTKPGLPVKQKAGMEEIKLVAPQAAPRKYQIIKSNILTFGYGHLAALYGLYLCFTEAKWQTIFMSYVIFVMSSIGVTAGAHRLWAHKSYKATTPLQILLMVMNTFAFQNSAITWVRDHRLHHKYSDTDADPHNATRGFFYSHIGWLLVKKHPEVKKRGKQLDMSDIYGNPVLRFQKRYAVPFIGTICFILPTVLPVYMWGESLKVAWHVAIMRYVINLHMTFLVNSAAHLWGNKPYDKNILPAQNKSVSFLAFGEGFHNYHHVFPWDYKTAELGDNWLNATTLFIDFFAKIGWAYDLKTVPDDMILKRATRTGDGSYEDDGVNLGDCDRGMGDSINKIGDYNHLLRDTKIKEGNNHILGDIVNLTEDKNYILGDGNYIKGSNNDILGDSVNMTEDNNYILGDTKHIKEGNNLILGDSINMVEGNNYTLGDIKHIKKGDNHILGDSVNMTEDKNYILGDTKHIKEGNNLILGDSINMVEGNNYTLGDITHIKKGDKHILGDSDHIKGNNHNILGDIGKILEDTNYGLGAKSDYFEAYSGKTTLKGTKIE